MGCIFCKIAGGEIPAQKLYEDDEFMVILDRFPSAEGHLLVVPKAHADDVFELDAEAAGRAFALAARLAGGLRDALGCDGINILQNNGEAAGQSVRHFHVHVVPRYAGDTVSLKWRPLNPSDEDMERVLKKLSECVRL